MITIIAAIATLFLGFVILSSVQKIKKSKSEISKAYIFKINADTKQIHSENEAIRKEILEMRTLNQWVSSKPQTTSQIYLGDSAQSSAQNQIANQQPGDLNYA